MTFIRYRNEPIPERRFMKLSPRVKDQICMMADDLIDDLANDHIQDTSICLHLLLLGSDNDILKHLNQLDLLFYQQIPITLLAKYRRRLKCIRNIYMEEKYKWLKALRDL